MSSKTHDRASTPRGKRLRYQQLIQAGIDAPNRNEFSVTICAKHAGVSKGTVYLHFEHREDYYLSVLEAAVADLIKTHTAPWERTMQSPVPRLLSYMGVVTRDTTRLRSVLVHLEHYLNGTDAEHPHDLPHVATVIGTHQLKITQEES